MQNELTPNELTNNELIMLDALAYYKQLSDKYIPKEVNGKITYQKLENFINIALNDEDYNTCFNDLISDEKNGMVDILKLVNQNPRLTRLEIVYPVIPDDENTSSVCLDAHYKGKDMYTWVENALGAAQKDNLEQLNGLDFFHNITS